MEPVRKGDGRIVDTSLKGGREVAPLYVVLKEERIRRGWHQVRTPALK